MKPIKNAPPGVEPGGGVDERRPANNHLTPLYDKNNQKQKQPLVYEDLPNEAIDWHLQATQAIRRAYKFYQLQNYTAAKAALFEFYYADLHNSGGFCRVECNR